MKSSKHRESSSRRSSILKLPKQRHPLQAVGSTSSSESSPATQKVKRRVSFAEKKHVKEFVNSVEQGTVWDNTYEEHDCSDPKNNENAAQKDEIILTILNDDKENFPLQALQRIDPVQTSKDNNEVMDCELEEDSIGGIEIPDHCAENKTIYFNDGMEMTIFTPDDNNSSNLDETQPVSSCTIVDEVQMDMTLPMTPSSENQMISCMAKGGSSLLGLGLPPSQISLLKNIYDDSRKLQNGTVEFSSILPSSTLLKTNSDLTPAFVPSRSELSKKTNKNHSLQIAAVKRSFVKNFDSSKSIFNSFPPNVIKENFIQNTKNEKSEENRVSKSISSILNINPQDSNGMRKSIFENMSFMNGEKNSKLSFDRKEFSQKSMEITKAAPLLNLIETRNPDVIQVFDESTTTVLPVIKDQRHQVSTQIINKENLGQNPYDKTETLQMSEFPKSCNQNASMEMTGRIPDVHEAKFKQSNHGSKVPQMELLQTPMDLLRSMPSKPFQPFYTQANTSIDNSERICNLQSIVRTLSNEDVYDATENIVVNKGNPNIEKTRLQTIMELAQAAEFPQSQLNDVDVRNEKSVIVPNDKTRLQMSMEFTQTVPSKQEKTENVTRVFPNALMEITAGFPITQSRVNSASGIIKDSESVVKESEKFSVPNDKTERLPTSMEFTQAVQANRIDQDKRTDVMRVFPNASMEITAGFPILQSIARASTTEVDNNDDNTKIIERPAVPNDKTERLQMTMEFTQAVPSKYSKNNKNADVTRVFPNTSMEITAGLPMLQSIARTVSTEVNGNDDNIMKGIEKPSIVPVDRTKRLQTSMEFTQAVPSNRIEQDKRTDVTRVFPNTSMEMTAGFPILQSIVRTSITEVDNNDDNTKIIEKPAVPTDKTERLQMTMDFTQAVPSKYNNNDKKVDITRVFPNTSMEITAGFPILQSIVKTAPIEVDDNDDNIIKNIEQPIVVPVDKTERLQTSMELIKAVPSKYSDNNKKEDVTRVFPSSTEVDDNDDDIVKNIEKPIIVPTDKTQRLQMSMDFTEAVPSKYSNNNKKEDVTRVFPNTSMEITAGFPILQSIVRTSSTEVDNNDVMKDIEKPTVVPTNKTQRLQMSMDFTQAVPSKYSNNKKEDVTQVFPNTSMEITAGFPILQSIVRTSSTEVDNNDVMKDVEKPTIVPMDFTQAVPSKCSNKDKKEDVTRVFPNTSMEMTAGFPILQSIARASSTEANDNDNNITKEVQKPTVVPTDKTERLQMSMDFTQAVPSKYSNNNKKEDVTRVFPNTPMEITTGFPILQSIIRTSAEVDNNDVTKGVEKPTVVPNDKTERLQMSMDFTQAVPLKYSNNRKEDVTRVFPNTSMEITAGFPILQSSVRTSSADVDNNDVTKGVEKPTVVPNDKTERLQMSMEFTQAVPSKYSNNNKQEDVTRVFPNTSMEITAGFPILQSIVRTLPTEANDNDDNITKVDNIIKDIDKPTVVPTDKTQRLQMSMDFTQAVPSKYSNNDKKENVTRVFPNTPMEITSGFPILQSIVRTSSVEVDNNDVTKGVEKPTVVPTDKTQRLQMSMDFTQAVPSKYNNKKEDVTRVFPNTSMEITAGFPILQSIVRASSKANDNDNNIIKDFEIPTVVPTDKTQRLQMPMDFTQAVPSKYTNIDQRTDVTRVFPNTSMEITAGFPILQSIVRASSTEANDNDDNITKNIAKPTVVPTDKTERLQTSMELTKAVPTKYVVRQVDVPNGLSEISAGFPVVPTEVKIFPIVSDSYETVANSGIPCLPLVSHLEKIEEKSESVLSDKINEANSCRITKSAITCGEINVLPTAINATEVLRKSMEVITDPSIPNKIPNILNINEVVPIEHQYKNRNNVQNQEIENNLTHKLESGIEISKAAIRRPSSEYAVTTDNKSAINEDEPISKKLKTMSPISSNKHSEPTAVFNESMDVTEAICTRMDRTFADVCKEFSKSPKTVESEVHRENNLVPSIFAEKNTSFGNVEKSSSKKRKSDTFEDDIFVQGKHLKLNEDSFMNFPDESYEELNTIQPPSFLGHDSLLTENLTEALAVGRKEQIEEHFEDVKDQSVELSDSSASDIEIEESPQVEVPLVKVVEDDKMAEDPYTKLSEKLTAHSKSGDCIWNIRRLDRKIIAADFVSKSLVIAIVLNEPEKAYVRDVDEIKIVSLLPDKAEAVMSIIHHLLLKKLNPKKLTESCKTFDDIMPLLSHVSTEVMFILNFTLDLRRLNDLNIMDINSNLISFTLMSKKMHLIVSVSVNINLVENIGPHDIDVQCILGDVRINDIKQLVVNVKRDTTFLRRYMSDIREYITLVEESSVTHRLP